MARNYEIRVPHKRQRGRNKRGVFGRQTRPSMRDYVTLDAMMKFVFHTKDNVSVNKGSISGCKVQD